jgi:hypothetical protein
MSSTNETKKTITTNDNKKQLCHKQKLPRNYNKSNKVEPTVIVLKRIYGRDIRKKHAP